MEAAYLNMVALQIPASSPRPQSSCHVDAMAKSNIQVSRFIWPLYCSVKTQEYSKVKEKKSDEHVALHPVLVQPWLQEGLTAKQPTWEEKVTKKVCDFQQKTSTLSKAVKAWMCFSKSLMHSLIHTSNKFPFNGELFLHWLWFSGNANVKALPWFDGTIRFVSLPSQPNLGLRPHPQHP